MTFCDILTRYRKIARFALFFIILPRFLYTTFFFIYTFYFFIENCIYNQYFKADTEKLNRERQKQKMWHVSTFCMKTMFGRNFKHYLIKIGLKCLNRIIFLTTSWQSTETSSFIVSFSSKIWFILYNFKFCYFVTNEKNQWPFILSYWFIIFL